MSKNVKVLSVENHKLGPVHSLLKVKNYIPINSPMIVNYCDFDWRWDYNNFKSWINTENPDSALCTYSGFHPHYLRPGKYAHVKYEQNYLLEIKEKESYTDYPDDEPAASGTFYFKDSSHFFDSCNWLVENKITVNNEYYFN